MVNIVEIKSFFDLYKCKIESIVDFFYSEYGVKNPIKLWRNGVIPRIGYLNLDGKALYSLHGSGCTVEFDNGQIVSFDFSDDKLFNFDIFKFKLFLESISNIQINDEELSDFSPDWFERHLDDEI